MKPLADRDGRVPTEKQIQSRTRSWHIRQLRAFFHMIPSPVSSEAVNKIQEIIDSEIVRLGAESEIVREHKRRREQFYED